MKVKQYGIKCLECNTEVFSNSRHDFKRCLCGAVFADGGADYFRRGTTEGKKWEYCERTLDRSRIKEYVYYDAATNYIWIQNTKIENAKDKEYFYLGVI